MAFCVPGFYIQVLNQLQIKNVEKKQFHKVPKSKIGICNVPRNYMGGGRRSVTGNYSPWGRKESDSHTHIGKESASQCRRHKRYRFDPWVRKIPGRGHGSPLEYSFLENPRGVWWATVHRVETGHAGTIPCSAGGGSYMHLYRW